MSNLVSRYYIVPLLLILALWSGWFIHQASFEIHGERYYSLFDDAMISMTYAKNVTQGHGLNWAKFGDPVEGFSSPLWTFLMIPFQYLPVDWGSVSLYFSIFCAFILALNVLVMDRILRKRLGIESVLPRLAATFTLAFLYPLNYWSLVGMECGPQVLLFLLGIDQFMAFEQGRATKHLFQLGAVLAAAMLLRMDMVFFVFLIILYLAPWLWKNKGIALKFLMIAGIPMVIYLIFRIIYFHDIFPNTYYLKLYKVPLDIRFERAWFYFAKWAKPLWLIWVLLPIMMIPLRRNKAMWLTFVLIATYLFYNLYVGGDAWEDAPLGANRFTIITMPWAIVILAAGGVEWAKMLKGLPSTLVKNIVPTASTLLLMVLINGIMFVPQPKKQWDRLMVKEWPYNTEYQMWNVAKALEMNRFLGTANRAATVQAGDIGYFVNCELVDQLGYNGREIARSEPYWDLYKTKIECYVPGHCKVGYRHTIGELKPDYIVDSWTKFSPETEQEYQQMLKDGHYVEHYAGGLMREDFVKRDK